MTSAAERFTATMEAVKADIAANPGRDIDADLDTIRAALGGVADVVDEWMVQGDHRYALLRGNNGRECVVANSGGHYTARLYERRTA